MILEALIGGPAKRSQSADMGGNWTGMTTEIQTASGVAVSEDKALTLPAIFRAADNLASHMAMLKLPFLERKDIEDGPDRLYDDPRDWMMNFQANPEMTAFSARQVMGFHALVWGNAYAEPVRNGIGITTEWYPIDDPNRVTQKRGRDGGIYYEVRQPDGTAEVILPADMLHIFNLSRNGTTGYPLIRFLARENVGLQLAIEKYASTFFGNGVNVGTIFKFPHPLKPEEHKAHLDAIRREYGSAANAGKPFLTHGGMEVDRGATTNKDAMMVESLTWSVGDVARWFNVPPYKLFELSRATFSNVEQADIEYVKWSLAPWLKRIEQEFTRKLVLPTEKRTRYFEHGVDSILRGDTASRTAYYKTMSERGMSINQILRLENMKGIGPIGDLHLVQSNMTTLEQLKKASDAGMAPAQFTDTPDENEPPESPDVEPEGDEEPSDDANLAPNDPMSKASIPRGVFADAVQRAVSKVRGERERKRAKPLDAIYADQYPKARQTMLPVCGAVSRILGTSDRVALETFTRDLVRFGLNETFEADLSFDAFCVEISK